MLIVHVLVVLADDLKLAQYPGGLRRALDCGLAKGGHDVDIIDLHADRFAPTMTQEGRRSYHTDTPLAESDVQDYGARVRAAEALVFVYRVGWTGIPTRLKGFVDRTFAPTVAFKLVDGKVRRGLTDVRRLVLVALHEQDRRSVRQGKDVGRRILSRTMRLIVNTRCKRRYLALYNCESRTEEAKSVKFEYLRKVERTLARL